MEEQTCGCTHSLALHWVEAIGQPLCRGEKNLKCQLNRRPRLGRCEEQKNSFLLPGTVHGFFGCLLKLGQTEAKLPGCIAENRFDHHQKFIRQYDVNKFRFSKSAGRTPLGVLIINARCSRRLMEKRLYCSFLLLTPTKYAARIMGIVSTVVYYRCCFCAKYDNFWRGAFGNELWPARFSRRPCWSGESEFFSLRFIEMLNFPSR